jgi:hypothetical protein
VAGTVVDGLTAEPLASTRVLAQSVDTPDLTCKVRETTTGPDGAFQLDGLCGGATYTLSLGDKTLMLDKILTVDSTSTAETPHALVGWRAPSGTGLYRLSDDTLSPLRSFSDVATETLLGTQEVVRYPKLKPVRVATLKKGEHLVMAGAEHADGMELVPLVADEGKRRFAGEISIEDHVYIGLRFASDTEWERVEAEVATSGVREVDNGEKKVRYVAADAVAPGRYAVLGKDDNQTYVFDFGAGQATAE